MRAPCCGLVAYWQLKDYGEQRQIGSHGPYDDCIYNLNLGRRECFRVLREGCRLCVNIADQFVGSVDYGRHKIIPIRTEIIKFCETTGMDYLGAIIWQKVTTTNPTGGASVMVSFSYPRNGILKIEYEGVDGPGEDRGIHQTPLEAGAGNRTRTPCRRAESI